MIYNEDFETLPREVLETLQLKRLKQVVQRVYHTVGFYRRAFDEAGVQPDDLKSLQPNSDGALKELDFDHEELFFVIRPEDQAFDPLEGAVDDPGRFSNLRILELMNLHL